jgi:hypothetical protein
MAATDTKFKKRTRVVATTDLRGVPEGTGGQVRINVGLTWQRYYVMFDNGIDMGSVGHNKLVKEADWPQFQKDRERLAAEAAEAAKRTAEAPAPAAAAPAAAGGGDDRLAALMAKSKAAKSAKAGDAPAEKAAPAASAADDRLAEMLAKSKAAREAKG